MRVFTLEEMLVIREALNRYKDVLAPDAPSSYHKTFNYALCRDLHSQFQNAIQEIES